MSPRGFWIALALVLSVLLSFAHGAASEPQGCKRCAGSGEVQCGSCAKSTCNWSGEGKVSARFCSLAAQCGSCRGTQRIACKECGREVTPATAKLRRETEAWLAEMAAIDSTVGAAGREKPVHAQSAHFRITWNIKQVDVKGGSTPHGGMHVYLDRLEALYTEFLKDLSAADKDFCGITHVMLWQSARDQEKASPVYTGQASSTESKLMGKSPFVSIFYDKSHLHEEFELHQAVVHQVAHCLLSNVFDGIWPGNIKGGWIDCGLAHAYEIRTFGEVRHYCYVEQDTLQAFQFGRWEQAVLSGVQGGKEVRFLGVTGKHTTELTPEEHMYAWSYVDYLLRAHPGKFGAVARAVKSKQPYAEMLQSILGKSPAQFQGDWAQWVRTTYSPKKAEKPRQ
ncbi:MAG: hypothetical protein IPK67_14510 [Planctomycetes bacterium]|jgi:hypothetical protein|nr:hypothetical protein [Planctomycetota bacterium]